MQNYEARGCQIQADDDIPHCAVIVNWYKNVGKKIKNHTHTSCHYLDCLTLIFLDFVRL